MADKGSTLVVMAAGMGSRYGGLKQLEALGPSGELLLDYSVYDAVGAGFDQVIFVIRKDFEEAFDRLVGGRFKGRIGVSYAFQDLEDLPAGHKVPAGRTKPWGTGQAVLAARDLIRGPFAVINADDYYGPAAYRSIRAFLDQGHPTDLGLCVWSLQDTLPERGTVSRGVCSLDPQGRLLQVTEIRKIERQGQGACYLDDQGQVHSLSGLTPVSMNFWGFPPSFLSRLEEGFLAFLDGLDQADPLTAEYLLPVQVGRALEDGRLQVQSMPAGDTWYGVTNQEDKARVEQALADMAQKGLYPAPLWA